MCRLRAACSPMSSSKSSAIAPIRTNELTYSNNRSERIFVGG